MTRTPHNAHGWRTMKRSPAALYASKNERRMNLKPLGCQAKDVTGLARLFTCRAAALSFSSVASALRSARVGHLAASGPTESTAAVRAPPRSLGSPRHRVELRRRLISDDLRRGAADPSEQRADRIATLALW